MAEPPEVENEVRWRRVRVGWSQGELARRAGLSRAGVGAIETGRLTPSTAAALMLAAALGCRVEDLFRLKAGGREALGWAWPPRHESARFWVAEVGGVRRRYPAEPTPLGMVPHDGTGGEAAAEADARPTLVLAGCDPAVGLLAAELTGAAGVRLLPLQRSSRAALTLLNQGLVHVAGLHLGQSGGPGDGNAEAVRAALGVGGALLRVARWEEGIACDPRLKLGSVAAAVAAKLRWVGREEGSGARHCLDEVLAGRPTPRRLAADHRGVVDAIRAGWADAGVCPRLPSEEAGLDFLAVRREDYDLCFQGRHEDDPRIEALIRAVRAATYRRALGDLPGFDPADAGALRRV